MVNIKLYGLILLVLFCFSLKSQDILIPFQDSGKWGYKNLHHKVIIKPVYSSVKDFENGIAIVYQEDGEIGVLNDKGEIIIKPNQQKIILDKTSYSLYNNLIVSGYDDQYASFGINDGKLEDYDSIILVIKDKKRIWYNKKGHIVFEDSSHYSFKIINVENEIDKKDDFEFIKELNGNHEVNKAKEEVYFESKNPHSKELTIISSTGEIVLKKIKGESCHIIKAEKGIYFILKEGNKNSSPENDILYDFYSPMSVLNEKKKKIIKKSEGYLNAVVFDYKSNLIQVTKEIHYSSDCEPGFYEGIYSLDAKKQIIDCKYKNLSIHTVEVPQKRGQQASITNSFFNYKEYDSVLLSIYNSNKTFNSIDELGEFRDSIWGSLREKKQNKKENIIPETKKIYRTFIIANMDDKSDIFELTESRKVKFINSINSSHKFENIEIINGVPVGFKSRYGKESGVDFTSGKIVSELTIESSSSLNYQIVRQTDNYNIVDINNQVVVENIDKYDILNEKEGIALLKKNGRFDYVNLKGNIINPIFKYYKIIEMKPDDIANVNNIEKNDSIKSIREVNYSNKKYITDNTYPKIVIEDDGMALIDKNGKYLIAPQENILHFERIDNKMMVANYKMIISIKKDKKLIGYYSIDGKPLF